MTNNQVIDASIRVKKPNRKLIIIVIGLILITFTYLFNSMIPGILLHIGEKAYKEGNYRKAYSMLYAATKLNEFNREARYYYVETLIKLPPTLDVQKELFKLGRKNIADSANVIAEQQILKWREQIFENIGDNYIQQAPYNNQILRWDVKKLPLKVYIKNEAKTSVPGYYASEVQQAFLVWQDAASNLLTFTFVDSPKNAQILVKIVSDSKRASCKQQECKYVAAFTAPELNGDLLKSMTITLYDVNALNQPFTQRQIYNIVLHEIGHSLGIMGHSQNPQDLMYMDRNPSNDADIEAGDVNLLSSADLNTLKLLYELIPDITNTPMAKFNINRQFFAPIVMGSDEQITSRKILEAKGYINSAPNIPNGYIDLAAAYAEQRQYGKSIAVLNEALQHSSTDNEKFGVYYNLAISYMNVQDWDSAIKYALMAKQLKQTSTSDIDGLIAAINFNKGNKAFAKQSYEETLEKNPQSIIDSVNLSRIYLREFNLARAGHVLNNLVKANPNAADDKRVKSYKLLMFFFR